MDLEELSAFLDVVETGSFLAAAESLGVSRTTLRRRVEALEARAGVPLLKSTRQGILLTEAGEMLAQRGRIMMQETSALLASIREVGHEPSGMLRMVMPVGLPPHLLTPLFGVLRTTLSAAERPRPLQRRPPGRAAGRRGHGGPLRGGHPQGAVALARGDAGARGAHRQPGVPAAARSPALAAGAARTRALLLGGAGRRCALLAHAPGRHVRGRAGAHHGGRPPDPLLLHRWVGHRPDPQHRAGRSRHVQRTCWCPYCPNWWGVSARFASACPRRSPRFPRSSWCSRTSAGSCSPCEGAAGVRRERSSWLDYERGVLLYVLITLFQWLFSQARPGCLYEASTEPRGP